MTQRLKKYRAPFYAAFIVCIFILFYFAPISGLWFDRLVSGKLSSLVGTKVRVDGGYLERYRILGFGHLHISDADRQRFLEMDEGRLTIRPNIVQAQKNGAAEFYADRMTISPGLLGAFPIGPIQLDAYFDKPIQVSGLKLYCRFRGPGRSFRITHWTSDDLMLRGGVNFDRNDVATLHLTLTLSHEAYEKLPKEVRSRMISVTDKRKAARLIYRKGFLTVLGKKGAFFRFQWQ